MVEIITAVVTAIREAATAYYKWLEGKDKREMDAAIDAAEQYIFANEDAQVDAKHRIKLLKHFRRRFFHYN